MREATMMRAFLLLTVICLVLVSCSDTTKPTYSAPVTVSINCGIANATIRYTLDGTDPTTSSSQYSVPITISHLTTLKAKGFRNKTNPSRVASANFAFQVGTIYFSVIAGGYNAPQTLTMLPATTGAIIHYTTDNTEPTEASPVYTTPILLNGNVTFHAKGYLTGWNPSIVYTSAYEFDVDPPVFNISEGTYFP